MRQRLRLDALDERLCGQRQARMARRDVEVVDRVAVVVLVHHHARRRRRRQREVQAALQAVAARLHARLHDALGDRRLVGEAGDVADGVSHEGSEEYAITHRRRYAGSADSIGYEM